jgi:hypothetical protein
MKNSILLMSVMSLLVATSVANAADHTLTAVAAGGLTGTSQPNLNGTNNPGRSAEDVPGQGSPLSGEDRTTPATDTTTHAALRSNPAEAMGKIAPSAHSVH